MDHVEVAKVDNPSDGRVFLCMKLSGRVNRSPDRAEVLYLFDADGAAAIVTELIGVATRAEFGESFIHLIRQRLAALPDGPEATA